MMLCSVWIMFTTPAAAARKKVVIPVKRRAFIKQNLIKLTLKSLQNE